MCRYCVEYGNGTKWYLNPDNYDTRLYEKSGHNVSFAMLGGVHKNTFEVAGISALDAALTDANYSADVNLALERVVQHQGQIIPVEDALNVIDLIPGNKFLVMHCACRRYFGLKDELRCIMLDPIVDRSLAERPWETDSQVLNKEEIKAFIREMDQKGLPHSLWDCGVDKDGKPPIALCQCTETDCIPSRLRAHFGIVNAQRKSEYVVTIDRKRCEGGCPDMPACMPRCPWGALRYSPLDRVAIVNISRCFGCGVCRNNCPQSAIKLVDRTTYPGLVDEW